MKVVEQGRGKSTIYTTAGKIGKLSDDTNLTEHDRTCLINQLGQFVLDEIKKDRETEGVSLDVMDPEIIIPPWV